MVTNTGSSGQGWYFYGITRSGPLVTGGDATPLELLEFSGLAAVVRPVPLAEFNLATMSERLQDASVLEATVRSHNNVIEEIHALQPILPAKFGIVYAHAEDVVSALRPAHDTLRNQLSRLEGCDEWAVHVYADCDVVREHVANDNRAIRRLRDERDKARPGRAYFLDQQLRDEMESVTEEALVALGQESFDRLAACAVAGQVNPVGPAAELTGELEILRASFLVARAGIERFKEEMDSVRDANPGLRSEYSGPWPPYSFAVQHDAGIQ